MKSLRRLAGDEDNATAVLRQHAARLGVPSFSVEAMAAAIETLENDRRWLIRRTEHVNRVK